MPNQIEVKSILAKLLATEDISVEHDAKMPTAAFDVKNRKLYLPMWKDMSNDMYDLFVGHEVGHAHETPEEGWHDTVISNPSLKAFLNIIEDARIERKVKARYPGLVKSFHKGYQELFDKDFFGVKDRDLTKLPFVDRVNLHFKIGHLLGLKFTETEQNFLDRVAKTETWEDVELLANELADISKQEAEDRQDELEPLQQMMDELMSQMDDAQEQEPEWGDYQPDHMKQEESEESEGEGEEQDDPTKDEYGNPLPGTPGGMQGDEESDDDYLDRRNKEYEEEQKKRQEERARRNAEWEAEDKAKELYNNDVEENQQKQEELKEAMEEVSKMKDFLDGEGQKSITDDEFRKNESELVDVDAKPIQYVSPQKMFKAKDWIVPMNELYDWDKAIELKKVDATEDWDYNDTDIPSEELPEIGKKLYQEFLKETAPIIGSMAQQFELKKAASANKKAREAKSGDLNEDKLWAYKLTEDLFQKNTIVPNGKNHGILMYVDLSGSMHRQMEGTLEQMMNMAMFCRKVNIPFDVYGFSNNRREWNDEGDSIDTSPWSDNKDMNKKSIENTPDGEILMTDKNFALVHMLSSTCKKSDFINAMSYLLLMKIGYSRSSRYYSQVANKANPYYGYITNEYFRLGGTPLNQAVVMATEVAKKFQKTYNVELLTTIFLTDGGATDGITFRKTERDVDDRVGTDSVYSEQIAIKDGAVVTRLPSKTGYSRRDSVTTQTLLEHYKRVTGSTLINFHIVDGKRNEFHNEWQSDRWMDGKDSQSWESNEWLETVWKDVLKNKFTTTTPAFGYDCRFLLKGQKDLNVGTEELTVKSNKKGDLLRGFRNFNKNKKTSRTFLNQIIELVA
jgi:hypothetical protein